MDHQNKQGKLRLKVILFEQGFHEQFRESVKKSRKYFKINNIQIFETQKNFTTTEKKTMLLIYFVGLTK